MAFIFGVTRLKKLDIVLSGRESVGTLDRYSYDNKSGRLRESKNVSVT